MNNEASNVKTAGTSKVLFLALFVGFVFGFSIGFAAKDSIVCTFLKFAKTDTPPIHMESRGHIAPGGTTKEPPAVKSTIAEAPRTEDGEKMKTEKSEDGTATGEKKSDDK